MRVIFILSLSYLYLIFSLSYLFLIYTYVYIYICIWYFLCLIFSHHLILSIFYLIISILSILDIYNMFLLNRCRGQPHHEQTAKCCWPLMAGSIDTATSRSLVDNPLLRDRLPLMSILVISSIIIILVTQNAGGGV